MIYFVAFGVAVVEGTSAVTNDHRGYIVWRLDDWKVMIDLVSPLRIRESGLRK